MEIFAKYAGMPFRIIVFAGALLVLGFAALLDPKILEYADFDHAVKFVIE